MITEEQIDDIFADPEAVRKLQYIYKLENGELVDEYKLSAMETRLKRAGLIGFMNDYCGLARCYITQRALTKMKARGYA